MHFSAASSLIEKAAPSFCGTIMLFATGETGEDQIVLEPILRWAAGVLVVLLGSSVMRAGISALGDSGA